MSLAIVIVLCETWGRLGGRCFLNVTKQVSGGGGLDRRSHSSVPLSCLQHQGAFSAGFAPS